MLSQIHHVGYFDDGSMMKCIASTLHSPRLHVINFGGKMISSGYIFQELGTPFEPIILETLSNTRYGATPA